MWEQLHEQCSGLEEYRVRFFFDWVSKTVIGWLDTACDDLRMLGLEGEA